jgi:hypothetical protein
MVRLSLKECGTVKQRRQKSLFVTADISVTQKNNLAYEETIQTTFFKDTV